MPGLHPDHVIAFRKRENQDLQPQLRAILLDKYASMGIIRINTRSLRDDRHSFPFLKTDPQLWSRSCSVEDEINCNGTSDGDFDYHKNLDSAIGCSMNCNSNDYNAGDYSEIDYNAIERCKTLREKLNWLRQRDTFCDVIVGFGSHNRKFPAHCGVLADSSELCAELIKKACRVMPASQFDVIVNELCKNEPSNIALPVAFVNKALVLTIELPRRAPDEDEMSTNQEYNYDPFQPQSQEQQDLSRNSQQYGCPIHLKLGKCLSSSGRTIDIPCKQTCLINSKSAERYKSEDKVSCKNSEALRTQSALAVGLTREVVSGTSNESASSLDNVQAKELQKVVLASESVENALKCPDAECDLLSPTTPTPLPILEDNQDSEVVSYTSIASVDNTETSAKVESSGVYADISPALLNYLAVTNFSNGEDGRALSEPDGNVVPGIVNHDNAEFSENTDDANTADEKRKLAIYLNGIEDPVVFELMLDYMYTGRLDGLRSFPIKKFDEVQHAADVLKLNIDVYSEEIIRQAIATDNLAQLWDLAENRKDEVIKMVVFKFASEHLTEPWMMNLLLSQASNRRQEFITYAKGQTRCLQTKEDVLRAVVSWTNKSPDERKRHLPTILPLFSNKSGHKDHVQDFLETDTSIQHLSQTVLTYLRGRYLLRKKSAWTEEPVCQAAIPGCLLCLRKTNDHKRNTGCALACKPFHRQISRILLEKKPPPLSRPIQLQMFSSEGTVVRKRYPEKEKKFRSCSSLRNSQSNSLSNNYEINPATEEILHDISSIAVLGELILKKTLFMIKYDHLGQVWAEADLHPRLTEETRSLTLASFHEFMVIAGGKMGFMPVVKPLTNWRKPNESLVSAWEMKLPLMNFPRRCFKVFLVGSTLYVCGGETYRHGYLRDVEALNISKQESVWSKLSSMKYKRAGHSVACTDEGLVYVVGGGTNKCEMFNVATMNWSEIASLPWKFMHCDVEVFVVDGDVVAMSSFQPMSLYILDPDRQAWQLHRLLGKPPGEVTGTTVCGETIYALSSTRVVMFFKMAEKIWRTFCKIVRPRFSPLILCSWGTKK